MHYAAIYKLTHRCMMVVFPVSLMLFASDNVG